MADKRHYSIAPIHPGDILREDVFEALGMTQPALAEALGLSCQTLDQIMTRERAVTPEIALSLERVVGSSAKVWMKLQAEYDLHHAAKRRRLP